MSRKTPSEPKFITHVRQIAGILAAALACCVLSMPVAQAVAERDGTTVPGTGSSPMAACDSGTDGICLYQGTNYGGAGAYWGWSVSALPSGWNDTSASLRNTFSFSMTIYTQNNYQGSSRTVPANTSYPNLYNIYTPGGAISWANQISSFRHVA